MIDAAAKRICHAQETASLCARCGNAIGKTEPVWRQRISYWRGLSHRVAPHCADCKSEYRSFWDHPRACEGCGRDVFHELNLISHRRTFCCENCERPVRAAEARRRRTEARGATRTCQCCGETFEPSRADARFCCASCKQRAYRARVTDNKSVARDANESRNADGREAAQ